MRFSKESWPNDLMLVCIALSATLAIAAWAIVSGVGATSLNYLKLTVEPEVVVLFVPLCILVLALAFEVVRFALRSTLPDEEPRAIKSIRSWGPGHSKG
jgi:predicted Co/Zn/Cd cation transporter (cation efflux family)